MGYRPFCSTEIVFCSKDELQERLLALDENMALITSPAVVKWWGFERLFSAKKKQAQMKGRTFIWINSVKEEPTPLDIVKALEKIGDHHVDTIVAIGGGSTIDLAKGISAFWGTEVCSVDAIKMSLRTSGYSNIDSLDIIAVPTTAGTGSEVTRWATIWDQDDKKKYSIDTESVQPNLAIIVPELTSSAPPVLTLSTGLDALCQAIEAYWSRHTSPLVQEMAYQAVRLMLDSLRPTLDEPNNLNLRERLCTGSVLSGLSFAQTRTTACHSISYPLTLLYGIPHGLAVSITLEGVAQRNKGHFPDHERLFSLFEEYGGLGAWMSYTCDGIVDMRLSAFGVGANDLALIADNAFTKGRMDNNPVELTKDDVISILRAIL